MIVANLATYPPRRAFLPTVLAAIGPQVDRVNLVLNEYDRVPGELAAFANVHAILPEEDTKDTGKFYPDVTGSDLVFLIDDDFVYPPDYVALTLRHVRALPVESVLAGYHCSVYEKPRLSPGWKAARKYLRYHLRPDTIASYRRFYGAGHPVEHPTLVDQVGTGLAVIRARDMPPFDYMRSSRKFVDVRLAKWCFERGIPRVCLPVERSWIKGSGANGFAFDETIENTFTNKHHKNVAEEIRSFAFRTPGVGTALQPA